MRKQRAKVRVRLDYLREWRTLKLMTQDELAKAAHINEAAHVNKNTIWRIESGYAANPATCKALAAALDITPEQLMFQSPHHAEIERITR